MGQVKAKDLIDRVAVVLQDRTNVRWSRADLLEYLNDAQRQIVILRPDANAITAAFACASQTLQQLPAGAVRLLTVLRNTTGNAITKIKRDTLDTTMPGWHQFAATDGVEHYLYNPLDPKNFYVFPVPDAGHSIDITYAMTPADLAVETDTIKLDDIYANVISDYMLYSAYRKDATYGDPGRANFYLNAFSGALGAKNQADGFVAQADQSQSGVAQ